MEGIFIDQSYKFERDIKGATTRGVAGAINDVVHHTPNDASIIHLQRLLAPVGIPCL